MTIQNRQLGSGEKLMSFTKKRLVIIGGTSGIGLATAKLAAEQDMQLVITGFKPIENEKAVKIFFEQIGEFDYLTTPCSIIPKGAFLTMETNTARSGFDSKFWGQYYAAKYGIPYMRSGGSIVFFSGVISQRPQSNLVVMASVNSEV